MRFAKDGLWVAFSLIALLLWGFGCLFYLVIPKKSLLWGNWGCWQRICCIDSVVYISCVGGVAIGFATLGGFGYLCREVCDLYSKGIRVGHFVGAN